MNMRNATMLQHSTGHSLYPNIEKAIRASERFLGAVQRIRSNRDLSDQGRSKEIEARARDALRELRDLREPLDSLRTRRAQLQDGVKHPTFDKADLVGAVLRQELRSVLA